MHWKLWGYIAILLVLASAQLVHKVATDSGGFASRYSALILVSLLVVGLHGYAKKRPLAKVWFWRVVFWVLSVASVLSFIYAVLLWVTIGNSVLLPALVLVIAPVLLVPALAMIHRYAYHCPAIWQQSTHAMK